MILKGNQRANGRELALHLLNVDDNEHAVIHELHGFLADGLIDAFKETEAISLGTKCKQYLFSLSLNPPEAAKVSVDEFERVIGEIERRMDLTDQPRAIVFHEKKGRRHAHCVWSRIDVVKMRAINLPHFKHRLTDISRELYLEHGWEMPAGLRRQEDRNPNAYSHADAGQAKRAKCDPEQLKALFKSCWEASDSRAAFAAALLNHGYCLARGDRRGFVAVDAQGEVYSLSRWCGVKTRELRQRLGDGSDLPDVEEAVEFLANTAPHHSRDDEPTRDFERQQEEHAQKLSELVVRQRQERQTLSEAQEARRISEIADRQSRLPTGLKAVWSRLSGDYQRLCKELAEEAASCQVRDGREMQALIDRHLAERHNLAREKSFQDAQQVFEREIREATWPGQAQFYEPDPNQPLVLPRDDLPFTRDQLKARPALILAQISDKKANFTRTDILRGLADHISDPLELRVASDQVMASSELVQISDGTCAQYTTREYLAAERSLETVASEMAQSGGFKVGPSNIGRAIKRANDRLQKRFGGQLSDELVAAIDHILGPNQLSSVVGLAGAGKSTLLAVARDAWERQGYTVHGAALAGKAADSLETASGIASRTLASLEASWKSGYEPVGHGSIVVIDEAGMVGTRQLARVSEQLRNRGCKLVLVGDPDLLQPIQAGTPFRDIVDFNGAAKLVEIRRQTSDWQRAASKNLAEGRSHEALHSYADHGAVHDEKDRDQAVAALVDDYVADWMENGEAISRLALAHRRIDVHAINQAIRTARTVKTGPMSETLFSTDHGPRAFTEGDRILFTRNDATLGVRNGMLGTIQAVGDNKLTVHLDPDNNGNRRHLTFKPQEFSSIDHGFAVSIHRSQGCTVDRSFVLSSRSMDEHLIYVALTRHKEETALYTAPNIALKQRLVETEFDALRPRKTRGRSPAHSR